MTPAEEITAAAAKLRALAEAATPGPWAVDSSIPYGHRVGSSDETDWIAWTGEHGETGSEADADFIATMAPTVGLALTAWLETTATSLAASTHPDWQDCVATDALAVARAINVGGQT